LRFNPPQIWGSIIYKFEVHYSSNFKIK
jgi:hypothetical protein